MGNSLTRGFERTILFAAYVGLSYEGDLAGEWRDYLKQFLADHRSPEFEYIHSALEQVLNLKAQALF